MASAVDISSSDAPTSVGSAGPSSATGLAAKVDTTTSTEGAPARKKRILNPTKKELLTILLIGETGSGKSSFMSLLYNLFEGNDLEELEDKEDPLSLSQTAGDQSQSQTTQARLYTFFAQNGTKVQILDTPGLGDTRGAKWDEVHKVTINNAIQSQITSLDAVIIMANGSNPRFSTAAEYTLRSITAMFPRTIVDNTGFIFTRIEYRDELEYPVDKIPIELQKSPYWTIQNPLPFYKSYLKDSLTIPPQERLSRLDRIRGKFSNAVNTLNHWLEWLDSRTPVMSHDIKHLHKISTELDGKIKEVSLALSVSEKEHRELTGAMLALKSKENSKSGLLEAKRIATQPKWETSPTAEPGIICFSPGCYRNCHLGCNLEFNSTDVFKRCKVFLSGPPGADAVQTSCKVCQHPASMHSHVSKKHVQVKQELPPEMDKAIKDAEADEKAKKEVIKLTQARIDGLNSKMIQDQKEIQRLIGEYNNLALGRSFVGYFRSALKLFLVCKKQLEGRSTATADLMDIEKRIQELKEKMEWICGKAEAQAIYDSAIDDVKGEEAAVINASTKA